MSAEKFEIDPELNELNEKFFVVESEGGKCRVAFLEKHYFEKEQTRDVLVLQSFEDFRNRYMNQLVQVGVAENGKPIMEPKGKYWLKHPLRRQFTRIDFVPGHETPPDVFNLWQGFAFKEEKGSTYYMMRHIWRVLAKRDREAFRYIIYWAAWAVQNPGDPAEVALVFRGGKGTGKGTFCRLLKNLFGQHGLQIFSSKHISGRFNAHLRDCVLLYADEAIAPNDRDAESILKGMLTEPTIPIEGKGRDVIQLPNHLHVVMASNSDWVVPASADERRFAVFDVSKEMVGRKDWFDSVYSEMKNGGSAAMLYFLRNLKLDGWHPRHNIPANEALADQRIQSLRGADRLWFDCLHEGEIPAELTRDGLRISTTPFAKAAEITQTAAGNFLHDMGCIKDNNARPRGYEVPDLQKARKIWDQKQFKFNWNDTEEWVVAPPVPF